MIESRCGLICSECSYNKSLACNGCLNIEKPFWGDSCPVKSCCEEKGYNHCGECEIFPCDLLHSFSFDKEEGDNGLRIANCRLWVKDNIG